MGKLNKTSAALKRQRTFCLSEPQAQGLRVKSGSHATCRHDSIEPVSSHVAMTIGVLQPPVVWITGREPPPPPLTTSSSPCRTCWVNPSLVLPRGIDLRASPRRCGPRTQPGNVCRCEPRKQLPLHQSVTHRPCSWTSVRCCEPPIHR